MPKPARPRLVELANSVHHPPHAAKATRRTNARKRLALTLGVRRKRKLPSLAGLENKLPGQRRYLTRTELVRQYGAEPKALARIRQFAKAHGLQVTDEDLIAARLKVVGSVGDLSAAFGVTLHDYRQAGHKDFHGRSGPIHVPVELQHDITGVFGFNNHQVLRRNRRAAQYRKKGKDCFRPEELAGIYAFPSANTRRQCLAVLEFGGGIAQRDLKKYFAALGRKAPEIEVIPVNGVSTNAKADPHSTGEVMLDVEVAGALVGDAKLAVYFSTFDEKGLIDCLSALISDKKNNPSVASLSWAWDENQPHKHDLLWSPAAIEHVNQSLLAAALLGITVCVATGDGGAESMTHDGRAHVCFPASSPYVLAIGGTTLNVRRNAQGNIVQCLDEVVWNNGKGEGSGGGVSEYQSVPAWQQGIVPRCINEGRFAGRAIPDVAAVADRDTGYLVMLDGCAQILGGTSAATPLWASLLIHINAKLGARVGNFNALLYRRLGPAAVLRDITKGNNDTRGRLGGQYRARKGWDACTGWGVPDGETLLQALRNAPVRKR